MEFKFDGSNIKCNYNEPTQNEQDDSGATTALTDLAKTTIKFQVQGDTTPTVAKDVAASSLTGGGAVNETVTIPALTGKKQSSVDFWATATDTSGNESVASVKTTLVVDRLAPAAPN